ncbi:hypothetical protein M0802_004824 [Mischocyttarus mexicanus]|nr:hypothetical protein M0802_004824 [Mischocyttarus mexicanus]
MCTQRCVNAHAFVATRATLAATGVFELVRLGREEEEDNDDDDEEEDKIRGEERREERRREVCALALRSQSSWPPPEYSPPLSPHCLYILVQTLPKFLPPSELCRTAQATNQPAKQPANQPTNQPANQPAGRNNELLRDRAYVRIKTGECPPDICFISFRDGALCEI